MTVFLFCFFLQASSLSRQKNNTIKCLWEKFLPQMLFILKYRVWTNRWQWQELQSHNHQVSYQVRMSPVQLLTQNRRNSEVRSRSAVFFPVGFWKSPRENRFSWQPVPPVQLSSCCAYIQFVVFFYAACFSVCLLPTFSHHTPLWRAWFLLAKYFSMPRSL